MIGGNNSPFRNPCAGSVSSGGGFILGSKPITSISSVVDAWGNTTQMTNHCGDTIPATKRIYPTDTCGTVICDFDCSDCPTPAGFDTVNNTPPPPSISNNVFVKSGTVNLASGVKQGGKWIQAAKIHHGRYGFLDTCTPPETPPNTKYLTITCVSTLKLYDNGPGGIGENYDEHTFNIVVTVDPLTGGLTVVSCTAVAGYHDVVNGGIFTPEPGPNITLITSMVGGCISAGFQEALDEFTAGDPHYASVSIVRTQTTFTVDIVPSNHGDNSEFHGSLTLSDPYTIADVKAKAESMAENWVLTDDLQHPFRDSTETTIAPLVLADEKQSPVSPDISKPCTVDDYRSPITNGTGDAPFSSGWVSDPKWDQMTWFDPDNFEWIFPGGGNQLTVASSSLSGPIFTGADIGDPLPAGYGHNDGIGQRGVFDRDHENYFRRNCIFGAGWSTASESRGAFTPTYLPANAPKWTDDQMATTLYPCAFEHADVNGIYLQKWCEIPVKRPSINFARPFGPEKFVLDETAVFFVSDFTAGVVTLKTTDFADPTDPLPFTGGDIVGSARVGGFFEVGAVTSNTVTLGTKVADLPTGWNTPSGDGAACFGKLRWFGAPGMDFTDQGAEVGGRVAVTVADDVPGTSSIITTSTSQKYLSITTPETVYILDNEMAFLGLIAATRVDDNHFKVAIPKATIANAKWITPQLLNDGFTSGLKYKFCDNRSKGDYVPRTWTVRLADASVLATTQHQSCLGSSACGVAMAGFTPNGESAPSDELWPFPTSVDSGTVWLGRIDTWMVDPFWQRPHKPVSVPGGLSEDDFDPSADLIVWAEDNGTCQADFVEVGPSGDNIYHLFYPMKPFVEARCTIPSIDGESPPAIASGVDITTVLPAPIQAEVGNAEGPLVNAIIVPPTNLSIMLIQRGCVQADGRFAINYEDNGTTA